MITTVSPRFSFSGWDWKKWLKGNKEFVKMLIAAGFGVSGYLVTNGYLEAAGATIVSKLLLDIVDYFTSEVPIGK